MRLTKWVQDGVVVLDGAQGTQLQAFCKPGEAPERLNLTNPDAVRSVHAAYCEAGAQVLYTNTFGANRKKLPPDCSLKEVVYAAVRLAKEAAGTRDISVVLDVGPIGQLLAPMGELSAWEAEDIFAETMQYGKEAGCDGVAVETMADLAEAWAALRAAKRVGLPALLSMSFEAGGRTYTGCDAACLALSAKRMGALAVGANCSLGPKQLHPVAERLLAFTDLPVLIKANAGLPDENGCYRVTPEEFAEETQIFLQQGVRWIGGCCGTTPGHIALLSQRFSGWKEKSPCRAVPEAICSASRLVFAKELRAEPVEVSKDVRERDGAVAYADAALDAADADPNALWIRFPDGMEESLAADAVKAIQEVCPLPLVFSGEERVLLAAIGAYVGRPGVTAEVSESVRKETDAVCCRI